MSTKKANKPATAVIQEPKAAAPAALSDKERLAALETMMGKVVQDLNALSMRPQHLHVNK